MTDEPIFDVEWLTEEQNDGQIQFHIIEDEAPQHVQELLDDDPEMVGFIVRKSLVQIMSDYEGDDLDFWDLKEVANAHESKLMDAVAEDNFEEAKRHQKVAENARELFGEYRSHILGDSNE